MEFQKLQVEVRTERGKGPARRLRARGLVPGVIYGREVTSTAISFNGKELRRALSTDLALNQVLDVEIAAGPARHNLLAMVQEFHAHPISGDLLHVDFITVDPAREVDVRLPLVTTGKSEGETLGGRMLLVFREVPVRCLPAKIPVRVEVDVSPLQIGQSIKAGQLKLPEGVLLVLDPTQTMVAVVAPEAEPVAEEAAAVEGVEGVPAEGAAPGAPGAPAAPGAAPAAPGAAPAAPGAAPAGAKPDAKGGKPDKGGKPGKK